MDKSPIDLEIEPNFEEKTTRENSFLQTKKYKINTFSEKV